ncbi:MAG: hypothetical protein EBY16_01220, partial [Gammaproteobacteria bacterium]|nr:hypothetical protein [Gammaproteobacteria bacterium]
IIEIVMRNKCQENVMQLFDELNVRELEILHSTISSTKKTDFKSLNRELGNLPKSLKSYLKDSPKLYLEWMKSLKSLQKKITTFQEQYNIELISSSNGIILGVSDKKATNEDCIIKLSPDAGRLTPETQQRLYSSDTIAKPLLLKSTTFEISSLDIHLAVMPKYSSDLLTFLGAQLQEEVATTQTQAEVSPNDNARILTCLPRFQTMAQKFLTLQKEGIFFPDAKNANWLVNGDSLIIADTKSLRTFEEKNLMDLTDEIMAPESRKLQEREGNPPLTPDEVEKAHVYLLACNIIEGITQKRATAKKPEQFREERVGFITKIGNPDLQQCLTQCIDDVPSKRPTLEKTRQILKKIELATKEKTIAQALRNEPTNKLLRLQHKEVQLQIVLADKPQDQKTQKNLEKIQLNIELITITQDLRNEPKNTLLSLQLEEVKLKIELADKPQDLEMQKFLEQTQLKIQLHIKESEIIQAIHHNPEVRLLRLQLEEVKLQRELAYSPENEYVKENLKTIQLQIAKNKKEQELKQDPNGPIARLELEKINLELEIRTSSITYQEREKYYTDINYRQRLIELYENESTNGMAQVLDATVRKLEATPDSIFNPAGGANKAQAIKEAVSDLNTTDGPINWQSVEEALNMQRGFFTSTTSAEHFSRAKKAFEATKNASRTATSSTPESAERVHTTDAPSAKKSAEEVPTLGRKP